MAKTSKRRAAKATRTKAPARRPARAKPRSSGAKRPGRATTDPRRGSPDAYIATLAEPRRSEIARIDRFIRKTVPELERGLAASMIGYGPFRYRYASGREGDTFKIMLSSRAQYISLYACAADARGYVAERYRERLPAADIGKSCVRFTRFDDLDPDAVRDLLRETAATGYGVA